MADPRFGELDMALLDPPDAPLRDGMDPERLNELVDDIAANGLLQPIGARGPSPEGRWAVVWGHRRYLAHVALKRPTIHAQLFPWSYDPIAAMAAENLQREQLNPIEEAKLVKRLHESGQPLASIARILRRSSAWVSNRLDLLHYPVDVTSAIEKSALPLAVAAQLAQIDHEEYRRALVEEALRTGASALTAELWRAHYAADRDRIIHNRVTVEEIMQQRATWVIYVKCESCQRDVDFRATHSYRFCAECSADVDAAIAGEPSTGDAHAGNGTGSAPPAR